MKTIAVFIDAENCTLSKIPTILQTLQNFGRVSCAMAYGNWSGERLKKELTNMQQWGIIPKSLPFLKAGKNAADIALTVEAVAMSCQTPADAVCIVSSDSDFTPLIHYLRQRNILVYGVGERRKIASHIDQIYDYFFDAETLPALNENSDGALSPDALTKEDIQLIRKLMESVRKCQEGEEKWAYVGTVGTEVGHIPKNLKQKFGAKQLTPLLEKLGPFKTRKEKSQSFVKIRNFSSYVKALDEALDAQSSTPNAFISIHTLAEKIKETGRYTEESVMQIEAILCCINNSNFNFSTTYQQVRKRQL